MSKPFDKAEPSLLPARLGGRLQRVADRAMNVVTKLGLRTDRVFLVRTRWSDGRRMRGIEEVVSEIEILPTPDVQPAYDLDRTLKAIGSQESGQINVTEVSGTFTFDQLTGQPLGDDETFYVEIRAPRGPDKILRRRYSHASPPAYPGDAFGWTLRLERAAGDRDEIGDPT